MTDWANNKQTVTYANRTLHLNTGLFINNAFVPSESGKTIPVINPSTEQIITHVAEADVADVEKAVQAAEKAYARDGAWRKLSAPDRGRLLYKLADLIEKHAQELAEIETLDSGKLLSDCINVDVKFVINTFRYYAGWTDKRGGKVIEGMRNNLFSYTRHEAIGVVGQIIPWNFPILMAAWKLAPALACGNVCILKTAENTPLSAFKLAELIREAGFPPGVVNIITGYGITAGAAMAKHPRIRKIAFTGSTFVGRQIMKMAAESNLKNTSLELGGKSPSIVFEDCDLDQAVKWTNMGIYYNYGQCCCAGTRIFVQESIYDEFVTKFRELTSKMKVADPFDAKAEQGPLISQVQFDRVLKYVEIGKKEGAICETGGTRVGDKGYFLAPTMFSNVTDDMAIAQEEIFGPVVVVLKFKTMEEVIERANSSEYGLAGAVFTKDIAKAIKVSNAIESGTVWVNCYNLTEPQTPFGGFKQSGFGRDLGEYALEQYTEVKVVKINIDARM